VVQPLVVLNVLSLVVLVFALAMGLPLLVSVAIGDGASFAFGQGMLVTGAFGLVLRLATRGQRQELQTRDGFLLVALGWGGLPAFAAIPLMAYLPQLSFTDAYFESASGLTTTGATVLTGLDQLPGSINLWRCQLQWMGGMGIILLAVAILPLLGVGGSQLFRAETPGPMKDMKLTPRIAETAKGLWTVYALITVACVFAMKLAGMTWLDALTHAFSTLSLGGYSSHDASFGYWNSQAIEAVTILFMLLAGMNFATHFLAIRQRSLHAYGRDPEIAAYLAVLTVSVLGIALFLWLHGVYPDFTTALRYSAFNVVSIATTTGYANTDYNVWPIFAPMTMLILCSFTTCAGSTGAGIKMIRAELIARQAFREMLHILHPRAYLPVRVGGQIVEVRILSAVFAFMLIYGSSVIVITMVLAASGMEIVTAFSAVIASINNMGPGLNEVGPAGNYAGLSDFQTWVCAFTMLLGRLELMTLLVVFTPAFWKK
jgi:trk system potassium uptake protein TrkH